MARGQLDESEQLLRTAFDGHRASLGADHPETLKTSSLLDTLLSERAQVAAKKPNVKPAFRRAAQIAPPPESISEREDNNFDQSANTVGVGWHPPLSSDRGQHHPTRA